MPLNFNAKNFLPDLGKLFNSAPMESVKDRDVKNKCLAVLSFGVMQGVYSLVQLGKYVIEKIEEISNVWSKTIVTSPNGTKIKVALLPQNQKAATDSGDIKAINWADAEPQVKEQVEKMWPRRSANFAAGINHHGKDNEKDQFICYCVGNQLIGCAALTYESGGNSNRTYSLDIEIAQQFQNQGLKGKLFEEACAPVIDQGHEVMVDEQWYEGEKTRQKFDVSISIGRFSSMYFLNKKTGTEGKPNPLSYNKVGLETNAVIPYDLLNSPAGIKHLVEYLRQHPDEQKHVIFDFLMSMQVEFARKIIALDSGSGTKEYNEQLAILKTMIQVREDQY